MKTVFSVAKYIAFVFMGISLAVFFYESTTAGIVMGILSIAVAVLAEYNRRELIKTAERVAEYEA